MYVGYYRGLLLLSQDSIPSQLNPYTLFFKTIFSAAAPSLTRSPNLSLSLVIQRKSVMHSSLALYLNILFLTLFLVAAGRLSKARISGFLSASCWGGGEILCSPLHLSTLPFSGR
jgi:hypothetical protein